jgi:TusA-related sulfurtransferase
VESRENTYLQVNLRIRAVSGLTNDLASLDARFVTFVCNSGSCEKGFNVEFLYHYCGDIRFSKDDSCHKLGLRHPVYQIMEALGRLKPGQAVRVETDDFDWAQTIEIVARGAGYSVSRERDNPPVLLIWR